MTKWVKLKPAQLAANAKRHHTLPVRPLDVAYDGGKMDGFNLEHKGVCGRGGTLGKVSRQARSLSLRRTDRKSSPIGTSRQQWVLADEMFQTQGSGSFTAHQDLIRGGTMIDSTDSLIDNPTVMPWGCDASSRTRTVGLTTSGQYKARRPISVFEQLSRLWLERLPDATRLARR